MRRVAVIVLLAAVVVGVFAFGLNPAELTRRCSSLLDAVAAAPFASAGAFALIYVAITAASIPGAALLTLAAGALFGWLEGVLLASFASTVGATLAMLFARSVVGNWVQTRFASQLASANRGIERDGAFYLFALRLVPLVPFFVVNLVMGLTRMRAIQFAWISQLGMLPGTAVYVFAGAQLQPCAIGSTTLSGVLTPSLLLAFAALASFPFLARAVLRSLQARRAYRGWKKPKRFDANLLVIGAGSAGLISALVGGAVRAKTILIERERMGGDCLHTGCVPSKALIASARVAHTVRTAAAHGIATTTAAVDFAAVMARVRAVIATIQPKDSPERYEGLGVTCIAGDAHFVDPWTVEVDGRTLSARGIVIASGAEPLIPPIPGLAKVRHLTSESVWNLTTLPSRLVILGAGPIGCELAQAFQRLGSQVTLVDMLERVLPKEDPEVSAFVRERFAAEGIRVLTGHVAESVIDGQLNLRSLAAQQVVSVPFDELLVAVGRKPRLSGLGLEKIGFPDPIKNLEVDERLATKFPHLFACGDVIGRYQFTHMAGHQGWYAAVNGLFRPFWGYDANFSVVPWATFTDPEVALVGLNESMANERGVPYEITRYEFDDLDRALADGESAGWMKVLTVPNRDQILGVTIVGAHASEMLAEATLAMTHRLGLGKLMATIHVYPTRSEAHRLAAGAWRRAHAPAKLLEFAPRLHAWMRGA